MKEGIHPKYTEVTITCSCGATYPTRSTTGKNFHVDVCSACHAFFTGARNARLVDRAGNVEKFNRRYQKKAK